MKIIYEPKGRAGEYAHLALNIYKGCTHGCKYCYAPGSLRKTQAEYFADPDPKAKIVESVLHDAKILAKAGDDREILLSFIGDPYQPTEWDLGITRSVINILVKYELRFTILTKGGQRAERDFDLLEDYSNARFGTTLTLCAPEDYNTWEPNAAGYEDRVNTIRVAHNKGIPTWVSLEPVIDQDQALRIIKHNHKWVDHWKVGKINGKYDNRYSREEWLRFRGVVINLLNSLGAGFYIKKSLWGL